MRVIIEFSNGKYIVLNEWDLMLALVSAAFIIAAWLAFATRCAGG